MLLALIFSVLVLRHIWSIEALTVYGVESEESIVFLPEVAGTLVADFLPVSTEDSVCDLVLDGCSNFSHGEDSE